MSKRDGFSVRKVLLGELEIRVHYKVSTFDSFLDLGERPSGTLAVEHAGGSSPLADRADQRRQVRGGIFKKSTVPPQSVATIRHS